MLLSGLGYFAQAQERNVPPLPVPAVAQNAQAAAAMGLSALEQMALQCNPTLVQAGSKLEAARGRTLQAGLYPNPTVGYTSEEIGQQGTAGQQGIFVDQVIVTARKLQLNRAKFSQEITQAEWQTIAQQYRVLNAVRMQFYEVLLRERLREVRSDLVKIADDGVRTTEELVNVGQANRSDLLQARIEARRQRVALKAADARYDAAWRELAAVVGNRQLTATPMEGDLEDDAPPFDWDTTLAHLERITRTSSALWRR
jgi:cobalt-zinc-cadmium efflux system outer membrane protein